MKSLSALALLPSVARSADLAILPRDTTAAAPSPEYPEPSWASYAPVQVQCPDNQNWIRSAKDGISLAEAQFVKGRKAKVVDGLHTYLSNLKLTDFDVAEYIHALEKDSSKAPNIGLAISGGAWASSLTGTGFLRALDARFGPSTKYRTGGILQSSTYLSGLSGGSWPVMSLAMNNFPEIDAMVHSWHVNQSHVTEKGPSKPYAPSATELFEQIAAKFEAGYEVGELEWLGRTFGEEFLPSPNGGMGLSLSNIPFLSAFKNHEMPFVMWQAGAGEPNDVKLHGIGVPYDNATIYEMNPFEFGAWNGPESFFPMRYLGTHMVDGVPVDDCTIGFDRATYIMSAAADAINYWLLSALTNGTLGQFSKRGEPQTEETDVSTTSKRDLSGPSLKTLEYLQKIFHDLFGTKGNEALFVTLPNPFALKNSTAETIGRPTNLTLIDESEMLQSLPLWSQIQPSRHSDFIIAWENDEDAHPYNWNNGTNLWGTYLYSKKNNVPFPIIPEPATMMNRNLTLTPTFFGCDANLTTTNDTQAPIILYMTNSPYSSYTNYSGFQEVFSNEEMAAIMTNSFNIVTQGNSTLDAEWPECMGCAAIDRSLSRLGMKRTAQCEQCFAKHCWDGVSDNSMLQPMDPVSLLDPSFTYAEWLKQSGKNYWAEVREKTS